MYITLKYLDISFTYHFTVIQNRSQCKTSTYILIFGLHRYRIFSKSVNKSFHMGRRTTPKIGSRLAFLGLSRIGSKILV